MGYLTDSAREFWSNKRGAAVTVFAVTVPVLAVAMGGALQYTYLVAQKATIQGAADTGAVGGAKQLNLANAVTTATSAAAVSMTRAQLGSVGTGVIDDVTALVVDGSTGVSVNIIRSVPAFFSNLFGQASFSISAHATAHMIGGVPICAIALDQKVSGAVTLDASAAVDARGCAVYSNSNNDWSIFADQSAVLKTAYTCAVGGKKGFFPNFSPQVKTGCPVVRDPLASRPTPVVGSVCTYSQLVLSHTTVTLDPGVYCGGLKLTAQSHVTLNPGEYIISGGPLDVEQGSSLSGNNVGFYLTKYSKLFPPLPKIAPEPGPATVGPAPGTTIYFAQDTTISLVAPTTGTLAGLLFYEDPSLPKNQLHQILSNNAQTLLGTIYLPVGRLFIGSTAPVAANSAYTIVVADTVELSAGPTLVLNSNYTATDVPVPKGVGPQGGTVRLTQ